jgi:hypothetical protein
VTIATPIQESKVQFCSVVSADSGEDPIGSAWHSERYIMLEIPLPWKYDVLDSINTPVGVRELVHDLYAQQIYPALIGFASDDAYSVDGMSRLIDFQLPDAPFSAYRRREYLIPTDRVAEVLRNSLHGHPHPDLDSFVVDSDPLQRDILVCTHGAIDACCAKFGYPMYKLLRHMADNPDHHLRVWRCTHFGGHRFAATLLDLPQGRYWGHLTAQDLGPIVRREGNLDALRAHYRGWAALPYGAAQVAEGELFRHGGWEWTECLVSPGETPPFDWENPVLEEQVVTFAFRHEDRGIEGSVDVRVSPNGFTTTIGSSNSDEWMEAQQFTTTIESETSTDGFFGP